MASVGPALVFLVVAAGGYGGSPTASRWRVGRRRPRRIPIGIRLDELPADADLTRDWRHVGRYRGDTLLRHHGGALVALSTDATGRVTARLVIEAHKADELYTARAFTSAAAARDGVRAALEGARSVHEGLAARYSARRHGVEHLHTHIGADGEQRRSYFLYQDGGSVLDLTVGADGRPAQLSFLHDAEARTRVEVSRARKGWDGPVSKPGEPYAARTWGEAVLLLRVCRAELIAVRERPAVHPGEVWFLTSDDRGQRCWRFRIADHQDLRRAWLGDGPSALLDPASLVRFGQEVLRAVEAGERRAEVAVALAALQAVMAAIPADRARVPADTILLPAGQRLAAVDPEPYGRRWLMAAIDRLSGA